MNIRKTHLAAAVGAALMVGGTAVQAQNLQVQLYGQVDRMLMYADNEVANKWFFVDNQMSSSRIGVQGAADIGGGLRAGGRIETEIRSNQSNSVNFASPTNGSSNGFTERWIDAFIEGSWGRVNLGQGSGAADDASTIDLSGTSVVQGATLSDHGGAIPFTNAAGAAIGATTVQTLDNLTSRAATTA
jgi:predicted porin